jgi:DnaJ-class molecular chaperone
MGLFDRLGDVIKSYLNDEDAKVFGKSSGPQSFTDPDLNEAFEELNDFLGKNEKDASWDERNGQSGRDWGSASHRQSQETQRTPESLRRDFDELGVPFGASAEECKTAYKKLLKLHHPDRHAGHEGNMKKATEKSARINAAYDRIEKWRAAGTVM